MAELRILVAGIGNIFLGDDGFGVEVAQRLASQPVPEGVRVADYGIRGMHLAFELLDGGYDCTILADAMPRGGEPGTLYVIAPEPGPEAAGAGGAGGAGGGAPDAHAMSPDAVLGMLRSLGGTPGRILIVGCEPAVIDETIGLSGPVSRAVDEAVKLILELVQRERSPRLDPTTSAPVGDP